VHRTLAKNFNRFVAFSDNFSIDELSLTSAAFVAPTRVLGKYPRKIRVKEIKRIAITMLKEINDRDSRSWDS